MRHREIYSENVLSPFRFRTIRIPKASLKSSIFLDHFNVIHRSSCRIKKYPIATRIFKITRELGDGFLVQKIIFLRFYGNRVFSRFGCRDKRLRIALASFTLNISPAFMRRNDGALRRHFRALYENPIHRGTRQASRGEKQNRKIKCINLDRETTIATS